MKKRAQTDFDRVAKAIEYIEKHATAQPSLADIAKHVGLSTAHFQKLFTQWAGTSPKKFLQYIHISRAKELLAEGASILETSVKTGLSGSGRLHDLFVTIEGMTPGEYKNGGANLTLKYSFSETPFGEVLIASTPKGVSYLAFADDRTDALRRLRTQFRNATLVEKSDPLHKAALAIFHRDWKQPTTIKLHVRGTTFQLKVWETLLKIPAGKLTSYGTVAGNIKKPTASRAVGTAVGDNPVAFIIPCHRVIQSSGVLGNYHWGPERKKAMLSWEQSQTNI